MVWLAGLWLTWVMGMDLGVLGLLGVAGGCWGLLGVAGVTIDCR